MVHASMFDPDAVEAAARAAADDLVSLTPDQREAIATLAADGDRLAALAEAITPMIAELAEFVDGVVSSMRAAGLVVDDPDPMPVRGPVVARSDDFDPPLTPAQAVRAQQAINDALVHDRAVRDGGGS